MPARADVVIVGAGYTGLWTAHSLLRARPDLDVVLLEAHTVGHGASGRNGGWVSALWPVGLDRVASEHGMPAAIALAQALRDTVVQVGTTCAAEGIDADFHQGGALLLARGRAQADRARQYAASGTAFGDRTVWLGPQAAHERFAVSQVLGATWTPDCARIHPGKLVHGLASAVRRRGARIIEHCAVAAMTPGRVELVDGRQLSAPAIIRATEAWTTQLPGLARQVVPVYSLIVATRALSAAEWERIGLSDNEVFGDHGHGIVYGQRTADDRLVFGGRGAPYHFGSQIEPRFDTDATVFGRLRATLRDWLPQLPSDAALFTHQWGGPLGIARDWHPSVGYDPATGLGWAGGYVGDGVAAANLAGRTLADLVLGQRTTLTGLPWVGHRSPVWEPEPLRWLGVNAGLQLARAADLEERLTGRPALLGSVLARLTAH